MKYIRKGKHFVPRRNPRVFAKMLSLLLVVMLAVNLFPPLTLFANEGGNKDAKASSSIVESAGGKSDVGDSSKKPPDKSTSNDSDVNKSSKENTVKEDSGSNGDKVGKEKESSEGSNAGDDESTAKSPDSKNTEKSKNSDGKDSDGKDTDAKDSDKAENASSDDSDSSVDTPVAISGETSNSLPHKTEAEIKINYHGNGGAHKLVDNNIYKVGDTAKIKFTPEPVRQSSLTEKDPSSKIETAKTNKLSSDSEAQESAILEGLQSNLVATDYQFIGWSMDPNATTAMFSKNGNKSFTIQDDKQKSITLYAVWDEIKASDSIDLSEAVSRPLLGGGGITPYGIVPPLEFGNLENEVIYDGQSHSVPTPTTNDIGEPFTLEFKPQGGGWGAEAPGYTEVGVYDIEIRATFSEGSEYDKVETTAKFTILPRPIEITAGSAQKGYDGYPLTLAPTDYTVTSSVVDPPVVSGHSVTGVVLTGSQTEEGSSPSTASSAVILDENNRDVTSNYAIQYSNGLLTVSEKQIINVVITGLDSTVTYNGTERANTSYSWAYNNIISVELATAGVGPAATGTDVGFYPQNMTEDMFVVTSTDPEYQVGTITVVPGALTILPRTARVIVDDASKVYGDADPSPFTASTVGFIAGDPVPEAGVDYTITRPGAGLQEDAGTYPDALVIQGTWSDQNYNVVWENGDFVITPYAGEVTVTITANSADVAFDGTLKRLSGYTVNNPFIDDITITPMSGLIDYVEGTNVGVYPLTFVPSDFVATSNNYSNVTIVCVDGTLRITGSLVVDLTANAGSAFTKVYGSGDPASVQADIQAAVNAELATMGLAANAIAVTVNGRAAGEGVAASPYAYDISYTIDPSIANLIDASDVSIAAELVITPATLTLTSATESWIYDGQAHTNPAVTVTGLKFDDTYTGIVATGTITNPGLVENTIDESGAAFASTHGLLADNYTVVSQPGTLSVTGKITVDLTANAGSPYTKIYGDADPTTVEADIQAEVNAQLVQMGLAADTIVVTVGDRAAGEGVAGSPYAYEITYAIDPSISQLINSTNITIAAELVITPATLTLTSASDEWNYDGSAHMNTAVTVQGLKFTDTYTGAQGTGTITLPGTAENLIDTSLTAFTSDHGLLADNYTIVEVIGTLRIVGVIDVNLTASAGNAPTKVYGDADPANVQETIQAEVNSQLVQMGLAADTIVVTVNGRAAGEGVAGSPYAYDISYIIDPSIAGSVSSNDVSITAELVITPATLTLTSATESWVYDGQAHANPAVTVEGLKLGDTYLGVVATGTITDPGSVENTIDATSAAFASAHGQLSDNYTVVTQSGTLSVTGRITVDLTASAGAAYTKFTETLTRQRFKPIFKQQSTRNSSIWALQQIQLL